MQTITSTSPQTARKVGELVLGGDWACTRGDFPTLSAVASQLAAYSPEPLHCELARLADLCRSNAPDATTLWTSLKDYVYRAAS